MKKTILAVLMIFTASAVLAAEHVFPAPAINGPTGLVRIPSAVVIPYKNFNVAADYGTTLANGALSTSEAVLYYKMNLGTFHNVEVGIVGSTDRTTQKLREGVFVNMKLSLTTGEEPYPLLLAIGVENLFSYTDTDVYMVATKYLKQGPKLTFGFMADFPNQKFRPLGMAGIESALSDNFFLVADLMGGESLFQVNAGARLYFTPLLSLNLTALNVLDGTQVKDSRSVFLGFSWANPF